MRLLRAKVENYRAISSLELSFADALGSPKRVSVLAGPNGCGKTSFLFAVTNALRGVFGYHTDDVPPPSRDDIRWSGRSKSVWAPQRPEIRVEAELQFDEAEQEAITELVKILGKVTLPLLPDGRLTVNWTFPPRFRSDGSQYNWWNASVEPALPGVRSWLNARALAIKAWREKAEGMRPELLDKIGGLSFFPQDRNLRLRVLGEGAGANSPSELEPGHDLDDDDESVVQRSRQRSVAEILHYLSDYARGRVRALPDERNWEKRIQDIFHEICAPKRYLGYLYREEDPLGAPVFEDGDYQYPLSQAASGEQVILEYVTRLTYPRPMQKSLILIDEPEVHLHPSWMRQLYIALPKLPDANQFILSTHSPELRKRAAADNALIDLGQLENGR